MDPEGNWSHAQGNAFSAFDQNPWDQKDPLGLNGDSTYADRYSLGDEYRGENTWHTSSGFEGPNTPGAAKWRKLAGAGYGRPVRNFSVPELGGWQRYRLGVVRYFTEEERKRFLIGVAGQLLYQGEGNTTIPFDTTQTGKNALGSEGMAIFVMDRKGSIYSSRTQRAGVIHHSSLLAGGNVAAAGEISVDNGRLKMVTNQSGHYMPNDTAIVNFLREIRKRGVELDNDSFEINLYRGIDDEGWLYPGEVERLTRRKVLKINTTLRYFDEFQEFMGD